MDGLASAVKMFLPMIAAKITSNPELKKYGIDTSDLSGKAVDYISDVLRFSGAMVGELAELNYAEFKELKSEYDNRPKFEIEP